MAATGERITVEQEDGNAPIDWLLSRKLPHRSRRFFRKQLADGNVQIDGRVNKRLVRVRPGQTITVAAAAADAVAPPSEQLPAQDLKLHVVYEDEHIIVVAKPPGIVVQPMASQPRGTLLNGVLHHMVARGECAAGDEVAAQGLLQGVVHRLDRDTSGIVIVAKNLEASSTLSAMFKSRKVSKTYLAVTAGLPNPARCALEPADSGGDGTGPYTIDAPLYKRASGKMAVATPQQLQQQQQQQQTASAIDVKPALTRVKALPRSAAAGGGSGSSSGSGGLRALQVEITTGRQHQIRAHLLHAGAPVIGDVTYCAGGDAGAARAAAAALGVARPLLHALSLTLHHPVTNARLVLVAPLPADMWRVLSDVVGPDAARKLPQLPADADGAAAAAAAAAAAGAAAGVRAAAAAAGGRGVRASAAAAAVSSGGARPSADGAAASKRTRASAPGALKMAKPKVRVKDAAAALNLAKLAQNAIGPPSDK
ncbi:pseudouridine synthase [Tribonema minus]|uniref:Pseudouridine synthase n=1 Tax=Tribonema minus TaxID=303371 RepID=A0A835YI41_9STRA|nr:pseudouridine synthase [Tribonema minus]